MSERENIERMLYEACLSGSVAELDALIEKDQLILDRVNSFTYFFNDTPLHVAVLRGHLDLTKALLTQNSKLAFELDLSRCLPLHIASTKGHVEIVRELLRVNTNACLARDQDACLARDQDGRTPLHLAAIKGRVEVIQELLSAKPESIHEKLDGEETVLHLCVKYNKLEALKKLVENLQDNDLLFSARDHNGNTILHLAVALKQMDTIKFLVGIQSVQEHCANIRNNEGFTALDVVNHCHGSTSLDVVYHCPNRDLRTKEIGQLLLQVGVQRSPSHCGCKVGQCISTFWFKYVAVERAFLKEARGHLITASTLTATMAYQAILSPPGGFWQEDKGDHKVGEAVIDSKQAVDYYGQTIPASLAFLINNSAVLFGSLCTIMLALSGFPHTNKFLLWLLIFTSYITLYFMARAYRLAIDILFPSQKGNDIFLSAFPVVLNTWLGVIVFVLVLHAFHFLVWLVTKLIQAGHYLVWPVKEFATRFGRCFCGRKSRQSGPNNHIPQNPPTTSNCCIRNHH